MFIEGYVNSPGILELMNGLRKYDIFTHI
jgi:hypothetical protein